jgi:hypothetical protein
LVQEISRLDRLWRWQTHQDFLQPGQVATGKELPWLILQSPDPLLKVVTDFAFTAVGISSKWEERSVPEHAAHIGHG